MLSKTSYDALPDAARRRLGMSPAQKDGLLCLDIRPFGRRWPTPSENLLRDRVYAAVHGGSSALWASQ